MADSDDGESIGASEARPGKRERLVSAASDLLYRQGVENTTLADIAHAAEVPLGNVYYYFKTKDEIVTAVIEAHVHDIEETMASLDRRHRTPKGRLKALIRHLADQRDLIAQYGCPHGTLCSELEKQMSGADHPTLRLMAIPLEWTERQFRAMGRHDAHDLAVEFMATYQGAAVLTQALRQPELITREGRRLERWIDSLDT
jgi:TetR/AcrR family transcriptional regulator, transcriptional repressor for nem operon